MQCNYTILVPEELILLFILSVCAFSSVLSSCTRLPIPPAVSCLTLLSLSLFLLPWKKIKKWRVDYLLLQKFNFL